MLIYIFVYFILLIGAYVSERSVFVLYVMLAFMAFLVGFRADTVGVDTESYQMMYNDLGIYGYSGYPEPIYGILGEYANWIGLTFPVFQTIIMFMALYMAALAIRRQSNNYCLSMFLMVSMYFFCYAMNIFRQIIACFIAVYACNILINDQKKMKFIFWTLIAAGFHLVALIMLSGLIINRITLKKKMIYTGLILSLIIGTVNILSLLVPLMGVYGTYIESQGDEYEKTGLRLIMAFFMSLYWIIGFIYLYNNSNVKFKNSLYLKMFLVGIIFFNLLIRHDLGLRITLYFISPLIIGIPVFAYYSGINRLKAQAIVVFYTSLYFFVFLSINSAGVVPYAITPDF